jgi:hypothetical protein
MGKRSMSARVIRGHRSGYFRGRGFIGVVLG